jgi:predicted O-methyltransferase YrrM
VPDSLMNDDSTIIFRELLTKLKGDQRFVTAVLPIGDGLIVSSKA